MTTRTYHIPLVRNRSVVMAVPDGLTVRDLEYVERFLDLLRDTLEEGESPAPSHSEIPESPKEGGSGE